MKNAANNDTQVGTSPPIRDLQCILAIDFTRTLVTKCGNIELLKCTTAMWSLLSDYDNLALK